MTITKSTADATSGIVIIADTPDKTSFSIHHGIRLYASKTPSGMRATNRFVKILTEYVLNDAKDVKSLLSTGVLLTRTTCDERTTVTLNSLCFSVHEFLLAKVKEMDVACLIAPTFITEEERMVLFDYLGDDGKFVYVRSVGKVVAEEFKTIIDNMRVPLVFVWSTAASDGGFIHKLAYAHETAGSLDADAIRGAFERYNQMQREGLKDV